MSNCKIHNEVHGQAPYSNKYYGYKITLWQLIIRSICDSAFWPVVTSILLNTHILYHMAIRSCDGKDISVDVMTWIM